MTLIAFILISASLLLHSLWHFLCKSSGKSSMSFFALFSTSLFISMLPWGIASGILFQIPWDIFKFAFIGALCGVFCDVGLMLAYRSVLFAGAYSDDPCYQCKLCAGIPAVESAGQCVTGLYYT